MRWRGLVCVLAIVGLCASVSAEGPERPVWRSWATGQVCAVAANEESAWIVGSGVVVRYDFQTGKRESWGPLDGLPLWRWGSFGVQTCRAGDALVQIGEEAYLKRLGKPWRHLATPKRFRAFALDAQGVAYGVAGPEIWKHDGTRWVKVLATIDGAERLAVLPEGFVLGYVTQRLGNSRSRTTTALVRLDGGEPTYWKVTDVRTDAPKRTFVHDAKGYVVLSTRRSQDQVFRIEKNDLVHDADADALDPMTRFTGRLRKEFLRDAHISRGPEEMAERILQNRIAMALASRELRMLPADMQPPGMLKAGDVAIREPKDLLNPERWRYDAKTGAWEGLQAGLAPVYRRRDPKTGTCWVGRTVDKRNVFQLVKPGKERTPPVLRTVPTPDGLLGAPTLRDADGVWWGAGRIHRAERFLVFRINPDDTVKTYDVPRGIDGGYRPQIQFSPNGTLWVWCEKSSLRYDAKTDAFVEAEPWDDFAVDFGRWRVSLAGPRSSFGQAIRRWESGKWVPLRDPFKGEPLRGTPQMIHKDRILLLGKLGVLEYDATNDRWLVLHDEYWYHAGFTSGGHRVLISPGAVLLLEGDPFSLPGEESKVTAQLASILKLLDADSWAVREDATRQLKKLYPKVRDRLAAAADSEALSSEVRARIRLVLAEAGHDRDNVRIPGLFARMHPLVE